MPWFIAQPFSIFPIRSRLPHHQGRKAHHRQKSGRRNVLVSCTNIIFAATATTRKRYPLDIIVAAGGESVTAFHCLSGTLNRCRPFSAQKGCNLSGIAAFEIRRTACFSDSLFFGVDPRRNIFRRVGKNFLPFRLPAQATDSLPATLWGKRAGIRQTDR